MNKYLQTELRQHVKAGKYKTVVVPCSKLPAMITICSGEICLIPESDGMQFVTQSKDRSDGKKVEFVTWENLQALIDTLSEINEAHLIFNEGHEK